ncbi:MAG: thiamine pyrophosphate-binding protein [Pseudomonadota bacterium]
MTSGKRGAESVIKALQDGGVDTIFTLSGNHIMSLFDAAVGGPRLIHTRHEAAAVHMADAYGRLTGRPGIAMATGGPGHANAVAGLYSAIAADSPMVLLSGHAPTDELNLGAFQELDQAGLARPVTKASWMVPTVDRLGPDIATALELAVSGRPGPVHVSLPSNLIDHAVDSEKAGSAPSADGPTAAAPQIPDASAKSRVEAALAAAQRPLLVGGPSLSRGPRLKSLQAAADRLGIPCVTMESPRGLNDPSLGAFVEVLSQADLILLVAKPLDFTLRFGHPPFVDPACIIVTLEPDDVQRSRVADRGTHGIAVAADPDAALDVLGTLEQGGGHAAGWRSEVDAAVAYRPPSWAELPPAPQGSVHPLAICRSVEKVLRAHPETVLICDGGEVGQWIQTVLHARRMTNSVSGAIGASLPFAIASRVAEPDQPVIAVMGDGTVGFYLAEFDTAVRYGLPLIVIVGNDACWNAERQIQISDYGADRAIGCDLLPTRYDLVCEAMGGKGLLVTNPAEMDDALAVALKSGQPTCINVMLDGQAAPKIRRG